MTGRSAPTPVVGALRSESGDGHVVRSELTLGFQRLHEHAGVLAFQLAGLGGHRVGAPAELVVKRAAALEELVQRLDQAGVDDVALERAGDRHEQHVRPDAEHVVLRGADLDDHLRSVQPRDARVRRQRRQVVDGVPDALLEQRPAVGQLGLDLADDHLQGREVLLGHLVAHFRLEFAGCVPKQALPAWLVIYNTTFLCICQ